MFSHSVRAPMRKHFGKHCFRDVSSFVRALQHASAKHLWVIIGGNVENTLNLKVIRNRCCAIQLYTRNNCHEKISTSLGLQLDLVKFDYLSFYLNV